MIPIKFKKPTQQIQQLQLSPSMESVSMPGEIFTFIYQLANEKKFKITAILSDFEEAEELVEMITTQLEEIQNHLILVCLKVVLH